MNKRYKLSSVITSIIIISSIIGVLAWHYGKNHSTKLLSDGITTANNSNTKSPTINNPNFEWPNSTELIVIANHSTSWDGTVFTSYLKGLPQIQVVRIIVPPNTRLKNHQHPMPNFAYVERGSVTVTKVKDDGSDGKQQNFKQGEIVNEVINQTHYGISGPDGVVFIVFYAGVEGLPLSIAID